MAQKVARTDFELVYTEEPHASCRKIIMGKYTQNKKPLGFDPIKWIAGAIIATQILALFLVKDLSWPMLILPMYWFGGIIDPFIKLAARNLAYKHSRPMHNRLLGFFCNFSIGLSKLVRYCYTGRLELQMDTVQILLGTANLLQFTSVVTLCSNFIVKQLNSSNCLEFAVFAKTHNLTLLLKRVKDFINAHFMEVSESSEFLYLEGDVVAELITSDDINVQSEEFIFSTVKNWIEHESETRNNHIPKLLAHVRLPLLGPEYILENVEPLCDTKEMQKLILDVLKYNLIPHHKPSFADKLLTHRQPHQLLLAISKEDCNIEVYNKTKWSALKIFLEKRTDFDIVVMNDQFFIMGGFEISRNSFKNSIENLCMTTMESKVIDALFATTSQNSSAQYNGSVYVMGGIDNALNSFQIWTPDDQKWVSETPPHFARNHAVICVLGEDVYVVGGKTSDGVTTNLVESYNIHKKVWEPRASMNLARNYHGLAVMNDSLFVIGGQDPELEASIERYNPVTNKWTLIPTPKLTGTKFNCTTFSNRIYVSGGGNILQEYDPARNVWKNLNAPEARKFILVTVPNVIPADFYND